MFNPKQPATMTKIDLLWLIGITFILEVRINHNGLGWESAGVYFDGILAHSQMIVVMKLLILGFM